MAARKPRVKRPVEKDKPDDYDSKWEKTLHDTVLKGWGHHGETYPYIVEHTYHPDFFKKIGKKLIIIEAKGRFWDFQEHNKYVWAAKMLPKDVELVFIFANPSAPMPGSKRRRDGTKRSHAEWADSHNFRWFSAESFPPEWQEFHNGE